MRSHRAFVALGSNLCDRVSFLRSAVAGLSRVFAESQAEAIRQRVVHWGPRTLDVDIILYDEVEVRSDDPVLPHPRFTDRRFVLAPLADIAPEHCPAGWDEVLEPAVVSARGFLVDL